MLKVEGSNVEGGVIMLKVGVTMLKVEVAMLKVEGNNVNERTV